MNIVIAGPGAIGCLFAALLAGAGRTLTLLDKDAARARKLSRDGIRVDNAAGTRIVTVRATADPGCIANADIVLICVKTVDTESVLKPIAGLLKPESVVVSLQNGLDAGDTVARYAGAARTVIAVTGHGATRLGPGHVLHAGKGVTRVAPLRFDTPAAARQVTDLLRTCGVAAIFEPDWRRVVWSKIVINCGINPVTALADVPNGVLLERTDLFDTARRAALEAGAVAAALGIALCYADIETELRRVCARTALNISSMLQDVRRGQRTEIDAINGTVAREGRRLDIPVPINDGLIAAIRKRT